MQCRSRCSTIARLTLTSTAPSQAIHSDRRVKVFLSEWESHSSSQNDDEPCQQQRLGAGRDGRNLEPLFRHRSTAKSPMHKRWLDVDLQLMPVLATVLPTATMASRIVISWPRSSAFASAGVCERRGVFTMRTSIMTSCRESHYPAHKMWTNGSNIQK